MADKWQQVLDATKGHDLDVISVHLREDGNWTYIRCTCGTPDEAFTEPWEFTDHIRRLVFAAISEQ